MQKKSDWNIQISYSNDTINFTLGGNEDNVEGLVMLDDGGVMCITCNKVLSSVSTGNRHVREKHRPNEKAQCRICKRFYCNERQRNNHYKTAHGVSYKQMQNLIMVPDNNTSNSIYEGNPNDQYYE